MGPEDWVFQSGSWNPGHETQTEEDGEPLTGRPTREGS